MIIVLCIIGFWLFCLAGRKSRDLSPFAAYRYAHRGLHEAGIPENSKAAFRAARDAGFGIEFDVHLLKDGNLGVLHDSDLLRITGKPGRIEDLKTEELSSYRLSGTEQTIPTFRDVLEIYCGKAPLIIELKTAGGNAAALTEETLRQLEGYKGLYCIESFDPAVLMHLRRRHPNVIRGQLSENYFKLPSRLPVILRFLLTYYFDNLLTRPDFVAHRWEHRKSLSLLLIRRLFRIPAVAWTIRTEEDLQQCEKDGWIPIFESIRP